nr:MAG TPA: Chromatin remodeling complex ATPase [Caudoviricetes sp.]
MPAAALFLDMGLGKTVCSLTAILELLWNHFSVTKVLVIAPKRVAESTWAQEAAKWDHTRAIRVALVLGDLRQREEALKTNSDVFVINRENVVWLMEYYHWRPPFDMLVLDESSSFKNHQAKRFRALKKVRPLFDRVLELTGTPTSNGLMDLWAQIYLLDGGKRLGRTITQYRQRYFTPDKTNGFVVYSYRPKPGAEEAIQDAIKDIVVSMSAADWLELPERMDNIIPVELGAKERALYQELEREMVLEMPDGDIQAGSAAVLSNKLLQLANGAIYDDERNVIPVHDKKLEALKELAEPGNPLLVFYTYQHDRERIQAMFPEARVMQGAQDVEDWNAGKISMLLAHPASAGYGLNLQAGGNTVVWFGLTWSLEQYQQANARLYRQGQKRTVVIHHLVAKGTMDEQVMQALQHKAIGQQALLDAVKARLDKYRRD